jgi:hypothetical protein
MRAFAPSEPAIWTRGRRDPMEGLLGVGIFALYAHCGLRRPACTGSDSQVLRSPLSASPRDKDCCAANFRYRFARAVERSPDICREPEYAATGGGMHGRYLSRRCAAVEARIRFRAAALRFPLPPAMESMSGRLSIAILVGHHLMIPPELSCAVHDAAIAGDFAMGSNARSRGRIAARLSGCRAAPGID